jgi:rare lipoprotein A
MRIRRLRRRSERIVTGRVGVVAFGRLGGVAAIVLLAACSTVPRPEIGSKDGAPTQPPPNLALLPDPVPHAEPPSKYGNKSPYQVFGKIYYVMPEPSNYREYGTASWYGTKFHGQSTSSGEPYDMYKLTAAHRSLPIPSYVRITNLDNHKTAIVRVNDRGPFHSERLIDVSYAAAVKLGFADRGTARVVVEVVDGSDSVDTRVAKQDSNAPTMSAAATASAPVAALADVPPEPAVPSPGRIFLQAGAFRDPAGAQRLREDLVAIVGDRVTVQPTADDRLYRVRIGPVSQMSEATRLQDLIVGASHPRPVIVRE